MIWGLRRIVDGGSGLGNPAPTEVLAFVPFPDLSYRII